MLAKPGAPVILKPATIQSAPVPTNGHTAKLWDGDGVHLFLQDNGRRHWRLKYRPQCQGQTHGSGP